MLKAGSTHRHIIAPPLLHYRMTAREPDIAKAGRRRDGFVAVLEKNGRTLMTLTKMSNPLCLKRGSGSADGQWNYSQGKEAVKTAGLGGRTLAPGNVQCLSTEQRSCLLIAGLPPLLPMAARSHACPRAIACSRFGVIESEAAAAGMTSHSEHRRWTKVIRPGFVLAADARSGFAISPISRSAAHAHSSIA